MSIRKREMSSLENCGFVLHTFMLPLIIMYILWLTIPEERLHEWDITYYPPKSWSIYIPTSLLCAFIAILFLNGAMNALITPKPDSIDTMWDEYSNLNVQGMNTVQDDGSLPEICDIDVGVINDLLQRRLT